MQRYVLFPFLVAFILPAVAQNDGCTATIESVGQHIGEVVLFCGRPMQVGAPENVQGDPVYLNFGGAYPDQTFSVVIWGEVAGKQRKKLKDRYTGKNLRIRGVVEEHNGKPEIQVKEMKDIEVDKGPRPTWGVSIGG